MSKTEMLRQLTGSETAQQQMATLGEMMKAIDTIHEEKVKNAEELAKLLEPLMSVMLKITSDAAQALEALSQNSKFTKTQQEEAIKTWNYYLAKTGEQAGKIQNTQSLTATAAQEIRANTAELAKQAKTIGKLLTWGHWGYPLAAAVLTSLLWIGFALWRMPDYDILTHNQSAIYELLKKVEEKIPAQGAGKK